MPTRYSSLAGTSRPSTVRLIYYEAMGVFAKLQTKEDSCIQLELYADSDFDMIL